MGDSGLRYSIVDSLRSLLDSIVVRKDSMLGASSPVWSLSSL